MKEGKQFTVSPVTGFEEPLTQEKGKKKKGNLPLFQFLFLASSKKNTYTITHHLVPGSARGGGEKKKVLSQLSPTKKAATIIILLRPSMHLEADRKKGKTFLLLVHYRERGKEPPGIKYTSLCNLYAGFRL